MKNITVTIDEETARWARLEAARRGMSLSRFLREELTRMRGEKSRYDAARRRYLRRGARPLRNPGTPLPERESLYDRTILRGHESARVRER